MMHDGQDKLTDLEGFILQQAQTAGIPITQAGVSKDLLMSWMDAERSRVELNTRLKMSQEQMQHQLASMAHTNDLTLRLTQLQMRLEMVESHARQMLRENEILRSRIAPDQMRDHVQRAAIDVGGKLLSKTLGLD